MRSRMFGVVAVYFVVACGCVKPKPLALAPPIQPSALAAVAPAAVPVAAGVEVAAVAAPRGSASCPDGWHLESTMKELPDGWQPGPGVQAVTVIGENGMPSFAVCSNVHVSGSQTQRQNKPLHSNVPDPESTKQK